MDGSSVTALDDNSMGHVAAPQQGPSRVRRKQTGNSRGQHQPGDQARLQTRGPYPTSSSQATHAKTSCQNPSAPRNLQMPVDGNPASRSRPSPQPSK